MTTWIERTARQKSMGQVILFLAVTAFAALILAENRDYWRVFFSGPPHATARDVDAAEQAVNNQQPIATPYVTLTGGAVLSTGVEEVTTYDGIIKHVSAGYYALRVGDRILIVKSGKTPSTTVAGELDTMPPDVQSQLFPPGTDPADAAAFYPLLLDTNYRESGWSGIFWIGVAELLFGFFAWRSWRRLTGRVVHPAIQRAQRWGDLAVTSGAVERELVLAVKTKCQAWTFTQDYMVKRALMSFDLFKMENLAWAYKKAVKRRVYGVIPIGTMYSAALVFSDGTAQITAKQNKVDELLALASARAPWALTGYSDELAKAYKASNSGFTAQIMARKHEMT